MGRSPLAGGRAVNDRPPRPLPSCPARIGAGTAMRTAQFTFVAESYSGRETELFGFWRKRGDDVAEDIVQTADLAVPCGSPIAVLGERAAASRRKIRRVDASLRANVAHCPCAIASECPALDEVSLLRATEEAVGR
jgi:hypothetical protein